LIQFIFLKFKEMFYHKCNNENDFEFCRQSFRKFIRISRDNTEIYVGEHYPYRCISNVKVTKYNTWRAVSRDAKVISLEKRRSSKNIDDANVFGMKMRARVKLR